MQIGVRQSVEFSQVIVKQCNDITTSKSPSFSTMSPFSRNYDIDLMETSFEEDVAEDHINAIWNASINYLKNSIKMQFDESKGLNDGKIFDLQLQQKDEMCTGIGLTEIISKNSILTNSQKMKFIQGLKNEKNLKDLLDKLMKVFCEEIFQQLTVIILEIWEKYTAFKETTKLSDELSKFLALSLTQIDMDNPPLNQASTYYLHRSQSQLTLKADQAAEEISGCYFISTKLKYINLREAEIISSKPNKIRNEFQKLIQVIARAVYLCADGCFRHPNGQKFIREFILSQENASFMFFIDEEERNLENARKRINN